MTDENRAVPGSLRLQGLMIRNHSAVQHPFLDAFASGLTDPRQDKNVFCEFYYFIRSLPFYMAGLACKSDDEAVLKLLSAIIYEETGGRTSPKSKNTKGPHLPLYRAFMQQALDVDATTLKNFTPSDSTIHLDDTIRRLYCDEETDVALGALYAVETMSDEMITKLDRGLRSRNLKDPALAFFTLHKELEKEHAGLSEEASVPRLRKPGADLAFQTGIDALLISLEGFWDGVSSRWT